MRAQDLPLPERWSHSLEGTDRMTTACTSPTRKENVCACGVGSRRRGFRGVRAAVLLEVLISIALLAIAITIIGEQVNASMRSAEYCDKMNRALMLAEAVLAEIELGPTTDERDRFIQILGEEGQGLFGDEYPGYGWKIIREPTEVENLDLLTIEILNGPPEDKAIDDWKVMRAVYTLRPNRLPSLDPNDFGMPTGQDLEAAAAAGAAATSQPSGAGGAAGGEASGSATGLPSQVEELLQALPPAIQEIVQRFLSGEAVSLMDINAAVGDLTMEDMLSLASNPSILALLSGGALTGMMPGGLPGGMGGLAQALGGAGGGGLEDQLGNLLGNPAGGGGGKGEGHGGGGGRGGERGGEEGELPPRFDGGDEGQGTPSLLQQAEKAGYDIDKMREFAQTQGLDFDTVLDQAAQSGMNFGQLVQLAKMNGMPIDQFRKQGGGNEGPKVPEWTPPTGQGRGNDVGGKRSRPGRRGQ